MSRLGTLREGLNESSYYLSASCQVNGLPALICNTKSQDTKSTTEHEMEETKEQSRVQIKDPDPSDTFSGAGLGLAAYWLLVSFSLAKSKRNTSKGGLRQENEEDDGPEA